MSPPTRSRFSLNWKGGLRKSEIHGRENPDMIFPCIRRSLDYASYFPTDARARRLISNREDHLPLPGCADKRKP